MAMGNKLIFILVFIAVIQTAQGKNNKLLKKIYKALKMPQDSTYLQDIVDIANNKADVADNAAAISSVDTGVSNNAGAISSNAAGVSNNAAAISSNKADISSNAAEILSLQIGVPDEQCGVGCSDPSYQPRTCVFTFTLEQLLTDTPGRMADGGSVRPVLVFNGVLPGPSIVVCQGDNVTLTLKNQLVGNDPALLGANGFNTTTLHFHGIRSKQKEIFGDPRWGKFGPWSDGVPLVTQCPIPAGEDFDYSFSGSGGILDKFNNAPAGSYWYHSHMGNQRMNGASGKLIVMPRSNDPPVDKDNRTVIDLPENSLFIQEWYTNMDDGIPVSILVNGKGKIQRTRYEMAVAERRSGENFKHFLERFKMGLPCYFDEVPNPDYPSRPGAQYEVFNITEENLGKIFRFRLISGIGEETNIRITIEDHTFTAIATDAIDIKETETLDALWISPAERYDILVQTKTGVSPNTSPYKMKFFYTYQHNKKTVFKFCSIAWLKYPGQTVDLKFDNPDCKNWGNEVFNNSVLNPIPNNITEWNSAKFIYPKDLRAKEQVKNIENSLNTHFVDMSCDQSDTSFRCNFNNFQMLYPKAESAEAVAQSGYPDVPFLFQDPSNPAGRCGSKCNETHCLSTPRPSEPLNCSHVLQQPTLPHQWFEIILININSNGGVVHPIHQHGGWYNVIGQGQFPEPQWPNDQRWKLDNNKKLEIKEGVWKSDDLWIFKPKEDDLIYIENTSKAKVLGATSDGKVILEDFEEGKAHQLWKKGEIDAEDYFTLENSRVPKVLTAISVGSESSLEIKDRPNETRENVIRMDQDCPHGSQCLPRNLKHPVFKDVVLVPTNGYVIFRTPLDNPGNWILHCHINFHIEHGMAMVLQFGEPEGWAMGPDKQAALSNKNKTCNTIDQTDHGGKILEKLSKELKEVLGGAKFEDYVKDNLGNLVDVADNAAAISSIVTNVSNNAAAISSNTAGVSNNAGAISSNAAGVSNNAAAISSNAADVSNNAGAISSNAAGVSNNAGAINSNAAGVSNNAGAISSNAAGVSNNAAAISSSKADISSIWYDVAEATKCTSQFWSYGCCTSANPCSFGKGDCDSGDDSSCSGDLICGTDNCLKDFGFGNSDSDCCIDASMLRHHVSEECTCQTITISLSGSASALSFLSGDYQESAMTNGHPSWINANYAIWYVDDFQNWAVGYVAGRGGNSRWIGDKLFNQGSTCPFAISSTNWDLWYSGQWNSGSGVSFTCSQAKILNDDVHGVNSSVPLGSATQN